MDKALAIAVVCAVALGMLVVVSAENPPAPAAAAAASTSRPGAPRTAPRYIVVNANNTLHPGRGTPGKPCNLLTSCDECISLLYCEWCPEDKKCFDIPRPGFDLPHPCKDAKAGVYKSNPQNPWCALPTNRLSSTPLDANIDRNDMHGKLVIVAEQKEDYSDLVHHDALKAEIEQDKLQEEAAAVSAAPSTEEAPVTPAPPMVEPVTAF